MTLRNGRHWAACTLAAVVLTASRSDAGVWGSDPLVGIVGDYSTNPALLFGSHEAQTRVALMVDAPTTYDGDAFSVTALPHFRVGNSTGYSSLTSNYEHLDLKSELDAERNVLSASAGVARDSSLYYNYTVNGSVGVQRDSASADVNWSRQLTERVAFDADINESRVRYGQAVGAPTLTNYSYGVFTPALSWAQSVNDKLTLSGGASQYRSLDGSTKSIDLDLQSGFTRHLSERWTVNAFAGYSRAANTIDGLRDVLVITPQGPAIEARPSVYRSTQTGTIFSVVVSRQAQLAVMTASASRQLVPSGFAFLSNQQSYEVNASYPYTARWTFTADLRLVKSRDPALQGGQYTDRSVRYASLSSTWHWTEHWLLTFNVSRVVESFSVVDQKPASSDVNVQLSRQFNRFQYSR